MQHVYFIVYYFIPGGVRSIVISVFVCLPVCLFVCLSARMCKVQFQQMFCACYMRPWLGLPLTAVPYVV